MAVEVPQRPVAQPPAQANAQPNEVATDSVATNGVAPNGVHSNGVQSDGQLERERLRMMMLIRRFEERTYYEYTKPGQKIGGFCHLYSGQEAIAVGTAALFDKKRDYLINGYRCHGHSLALGMSPRSAMAELFGKETGCSKGKGGSMHLFDASVGNNGGHGIVGGQLPLGAGMAFAQWYKKNGGVTFTFMGDGAINQGTHNEALNLASLWKLPVIWVIEKQRRRHGHAGRASQCGERLGQTWQRLQHAVLQCRRK